MISRSPSNFMTRRGLVVEAASPRSRLNADDLLIHRQPLLPGPPLPGRPAQAKAEGFPPPDRGELLPLI